MMDIREMKAGRDLDELIMAKVMGWKKEADHKPLPMWRDNNGFNVDHIERFFTPSVDISAAWEIAEKFNFCIDNAGYGEKKYRVILNELNNNNDVYRPEAFGETAPLAICRASLLQKEER